MTLENRRAHNEFGGGLRGLNHQAALAAIRLAKSAGLPVLAFGPHADIALHETTRTAGADQVVPKSKLVRSFPDLVSQLLAGN